MGVLSSAQPDREEYALDWREQRMSDLAHILAICTSIDDDSSGTICWEEFKKHTSDHRVVSYFASLDLDIKYAEVFFRMLEQIVGSKEVPLEAFAEGCMHMKGQASSIDLHILSVQLKMFEKSQAAIVSSLLHEQHAIKHVLQEFADINGAHTLQESVSSLDRHRGLNARMAIENEVVRC